MHEYGDDFYAFLSSFAVRSARRVAPVVLAATKSTSIADFGCGQGAWLSVWKSAGLQVRGVDGPYVNRDRLLIDQSEFQPANLAAPIDLGRRFDIVQSLETAEHLPAGRAAGFVADLTRHSSHVLFSAAVPGQGGEHHINEQPLEYWRALFRAQNYLPVDLVRPAVANDAEVQTWYRCNTVLYVHGDSLAALPDAARACLVPEGTALREYWPLRERLQQAVVRRLPVATVDWLAGIKARQYQRK